MYLLCSSFLNKLTFYRRLTDPPLLSSNFENLYALCKRTYKHKLSRFKGLDWRWWVRRLSEGMGQFYILYKDLWMTTIMSGRKFYDQQLICPKSVKIISGRLDSNKATGNSPQRSKWIRKRTLGIKLFNRKLATLNGKDTGTSRCNHNEHQLPSVSGDRSAGQNSQLPQSAGNVSKKYCSRKLRKITPVCEIDLGRDRRHFYKVFIKFTMYFFVYSGWIL